MYFARESQQRPFLKVVNAIIKSELGGLVAASDLGQWQETLAILSTYAKQVLWVYKMLLLLLLFILPSTGLFFVTCVGGFVGATGIYERGTGHGMI